MIPENLLARGFALLGAGISLALSLAASGADLRPLAPNELPLLAGDYRVAVYPQPFGFAVRDGVLYLKVGGLASSANEVPLLAREDGKFVLAEGHPNAFQFLLEGNEIRFTFWSAGQAFAGTREGSAATEQTQPKPRAAPSERRRADVEAELAAADGSDSTANDPTSRLRRAKLLFESGRFEQARALATELAAEPAPEDGALELSARLDALLGHLDEAERRYDQLIAARAGKLSSQVMAKVGKMLALYQRDRFGAIRELDFPAGVVLPNLTLARAFEQNPYRLEWRSEDHTATLPFIATDPLPLFTIEVEGIPLQVFFDTGADLLILDEEIAARLGIESLARATGSFGGGLPAPVGFGKVKHIALGAVSVHDVPVMILPTKRFSMDGGKHIVGGILGTALMRQFLGTLDYRNERLVLRERGPEASAARRRELASRLAAEVPFVLDVTHLLFARGKLDDAKDLTFFVDSGLASEAAFSAPPQTLEAAGIPIPEVAVKDGSVGGGGGRFATGTFAIRSLALGPLVQTDLRGEFGALTPESYWARGFIQDGLISHRFLRRYGSWTIDFDRRTFLFER